MATAPLPAGTDQLGLTIDETHGDSVLAELELPEGSPYRQSTDVLCESGVEEGVAAQVVIEARPGDPSTCPEKHLVVVWLGNFMTGPSVSIEQNRHFRGLGVSLLANMLGWIKRERREWLLDGGRADETIVGIEAKNQRTTVCRSFFGIKIQARREDDARDQNALQRYYESIGFAEDARFIDERNNGTKGYSARIGHLIKSLFEAVPKGVIEGVGEPR